MIPCDMLFACDRARDGLNKAMHCHRLRAVLEWVVLDERNFGKRGERFHALHFVLNGALDQCHWDTLGRALSEIRHERFGRSGSRHATTSRDAPEP